MRQPLVAGNWKMNGSKASAEALLAGIKEGMPGITKAEVLVCPPFPYLAQAVSVLAGSGAGVGAQNACTEAAGAYTGEVSAAMVKDIGCSYVILGHSERRQYYSETDAVIAKKYAQALAAGLTPILCVGETLAERERGETEAVVGRHLDGVMETAGVEAIARGVVAYEPVWAIGTGVTATPEQAQEVHAFLRRRIAAKSAEVAAGVRILYGGSMKPDNALELMCQTDIDGGLIGGASLKASDFLAICQAGEANA
jgi:triosephosphate isomerase (TIM)